MFFSNKQSNRTDYSTLGLLYWNKYPKGYNVSPWSHIANKNCSKSISVADISCL